MGYEADERIEITLEGGMRMCASGAEGIAITVDAPSQYGGSGKGFTPMELLLIGLGTCTGMDVITILRKKRQEVTEYHVEVAGVRAEGHPKVFTDISVRHIVRGNYVAEEAVRRSIELSETKYCPAYAMLSATAHITSTFEVHPAAPPD